MYHKSSEVKETDILRWAITLYLNVGVVTQGMNSKIIAFDDLKSLIIDKGFCTICGACEAACPLHAIKINHNIPERLYDCSKYLDLCPICFDICPHSDALLFESLGFVADATHRRESLGYYRKILLAQAADPSIRNSTKSGGVLNALLNFALDQKIIDGAVFSRTSPSLAVKVKPSVGLVPDDTLSAVDSKVVPSAVAKAFGKAVFEHGRTHIAFVGIPCHVLALRKLEAWQHKIIDSLEVIIGLFCLWSFSLELLLEYLLQEHGVAAIEIKNVDLVGDEYIVATKDKTLRLTLADVKAHIMNRCKTCTDFTAEFSDISIGRASPLKNWSIVIVRTKRGEVLINKACEKGIIVTKAIESEPDVFFHLTQLSMQKRKSALEEIGKIVEKGMPIPGAAKALTRLEIREVKLLEEVKVEEIMTRNVISLTSDVTVAEFLENIAKYHHVGFPVKDAAGRLIGIATLQDAMKVPKENRNSTTVGEICSKKLVTIYPDNSVAEAFDKMVSHDIGRLLVVNRRDKHMLLGIITRSDIMHALRK